MNHNIHHIFISFGSPEYDECVRLRTEILRKPLGLEFTVEQLEQEYKDWHLATYDQHFRLLGCMILSPMEDGSVKMRQVAVAESLQGQGIGMRMAKFAEDFAFERKSPLIWCHARAVAVPFYKKLGYKQVGNEFQEVGIPHFKMEKRLINK